MLDLSAGQFVRAFGFNGNLAKFTKDRELPEACIFVSGSCRRKFSASLSLTPLGSVAHNSRMRAGLFNVNKNVLVNI